jgi:hypothetical protein
MKTREAGTSVMIMAYSSASGYESIFDVTASRENGKTHGH